jgi:hypothetical protein
MNYADPTGIAMCKIWFYLMNRFNPHAKITVFCGDHSNAIRHVGQGYSHVAFVEPSRVGMPDCSRLRGFSHPSLALTLPAWKHIEEHKGFEKFLYIEADAWVMVPLDQWWAIADEKPFIAVSQRNLKGRPHFNTGTFSYRSKEKFLSFTHLMEQYRLDGDAIVLPAGEQGLINARFRRIDYDATHPKIGFEYNCLAYNCNVERADDGEIQVRSGVKPESLPASLKWLGNWDGWKERRMAKILHAFGPKYWFLPECWSLMAYCLGAAERHTQLPTMAET